MVSSDVVVGRQVMRLDVQVAHLGIGQARLGELSEPGGTVEDPHGDAEGDAELGSIRTCCPRRLPEATAKLDYQ